MSLDWNLSKIENSDALCWVKRPGPDGEIGEYLSPVTESIIWSTIVVNIGSITEKNWEKFYERLNFYEKLFNPLSHKDGVGVFITAEQVKQHIGLWTNVMDKTDAQWLKHVWNCWHRHIGIERKAV
jgi:hypothetical protein